MAHLPTARRRRMGAALLLAGITAAALSSCSTGGKDKDGPAHTPSASAPPKGVVTQAQADKILDHYQEVNNKANKTRSASLLATVEAGQLYARSKANYEQFSALSAKKQKAQGNPFYFTKRSFYIPPSGDWFAAEATTNGKNHTFMIFEKSADTGRWKKTVSLFPQKAIPRPVVKNGLAVVADAATAVGPLAPTGVTDAVEDLFATGGTEGGTKLSHSNENAQSILKTYKERNDHLGSRASVRYFPIPPLHHKTYTLATSTGVLAVTPLAHKQETLVTNPGLQITPGNAEALYNKTPRSVVVDSFQGETAVHLPTQGTPEILDYQYAMVDSR